MTTTTERRHRRGARLRAGPRTMALAIIAALAMLVGPAGSVFAPTPADAQTSRRDRFTGGRNMLQCARSVMEYAYDKEPKLGDVEGWCETHNGRVPNLIATNRVTDVWNISSGAENVIIIGQKGTVPGFSPSSIGDVIRDAESQFFTPEKLTDRKFDGIRRSFQLRKANAGFTNRAENQWNDVIKPALDDALRTRGKIRKPTMVVVTGHSLGGAAATLLGPVVHSYLKRHTVEDTETRTVAVPFNAPRTGGFDFVADYAGVLTDGNAATDDFMFLLQMTREDDPVPTWPRSLFVTVAHPVWNPEAKRCLNGTGWWSAENSKFSDARKCLAYPPHIQAESVGKDWKNHKRTFWYRQIDEIGPTSTAGEALERLNAFVGWGT